MKGRPLAWLDYFQENHKKALLRDFGPDVHLLEELIDLVSQCVDEINVALPDSDLQQLYESKTKSSVFRPTCSTKLDSNYGGDQLNHRWIA